MQCSMTRVVSPLRFSVSVPLCADLFALLLALSFEQRAVAAAAVVVAAAAATPTPRAIFLLTAGTIEKHKRKQGVKARP